MYSRIVQILTSRLQIIRESCFIHVPGGAPREMLASRDTSNIIRMVIFGSNLSSHSTSICEPGLTKGRYCRKQKNLNSLYNTYYYTIIMILLSLEASMWLARGKKVDVFFTCDTILSLVTVQYSTVQYSIIPSSLIIILNTYSIKLGVAHSII